MGEKVWILERKTHPEETILEKEEMAVELHSEEAIPKEDAEVSILEEEEVHSKEAILNSPPAAMQVATRHGGPILQLLDIVLSPFATNALCSGAFVSPYG